VKRESAARLRVLAAAALFSTGGAAIKAAAFNSWQVTSFRSGIAALAILVLIPAARRGWSWRLVPVATLYASTLILFVTANKLTTAASTIFLQSTSPLYILLLGPWLLRERVRRADLAFVALVGLGLAACFLGTPQPLATAPDPTKGNVLAALSGLTYAGVVVGLRWIGTNGGSREPGAGSRTGGSVEGAVALGNLIACLVCLPMALPVAPAAPSDWAVVVYLGVFQIGVAYVFLGVALRTVSALEVSLLLLLEPTLNPIWAWLVQGEVPGVWTLVGGAVILGATVMRMLVRGAPGDNPPVAA
jgi:drug/metabolite transporter, DME family